MPEVKMDLGPLKPLPSDWESPKQERKRLAKGRVSRVKCRDCGQACFWAQRDGRWALHNPSGKWHWARCPARKAARAASYGIRQLQLEGLSRIAREP